MIRICFVVQIPAVTAPSHILRQLSLVWSPNYRIHLKSLSELLLPLVEFVPFAGSNFPPSDSVTETLAQLGSHLEDCH